MKYIFITLLTVLTTTLYSQVNKTQLIMCPLSVTFEKDSTQNIWGLLTAIPSEWSTICLITPQENVKEDWTYGQWIYTNCKAEPVSEVFVTVYATRQRLNSSLGEVQVQTYSCAYALIERKKKNK